MSDYKIKRSVGATHVIPDMSEGPVAWWHASPGKQPLWKTFAAMRDSGLTAVASLLRAHPTKQLWENVRRAFRTEGIDTIVITPLHWASTEWNYDRTVKNLRWENWPDDIFEMLFRTYGKQHKTIIVQTMELDWTVAGIGCRDADKCIHDGRYDRYLGACKAGTLVRYPEVEDEKDCKVVAATMVKIDRAAYLRGVCDNLQLKAEEARANHPYANLKVYFAMEVNFFTDESYIVARDLIPKMSNPPDLVGLSLYKKGGDPVMAFKNVQTWTGLPPDRIYIAEVGWKEGTQRDGKVIGGTPQYDRIVPVVNDLFTLGAPLAMVWSWAEISYTGGHTGYAVNDAVTGEALSGRAAIASLNETWRKETCPTCNGTGEV
jgi:hypothetical protein